MARGKTKYRIRKTAKAKGPTKIVKITTKKESKDDVVMKESKKAIKKAIKKRSDQKTMQQVGDDALKMLAKKEPEFTDPALKAINGSMHNAGKNFCGEKLAAKLEDNLDKAHQHISNLNTDMLKMLKAKENADIQLGRILNTYVTISAIPKPCEESKGVSPVNEEDLSNMFNNMQYA
jgi:uncharacterized membrane protein YheB (UPF0754 family)